MDTADPKTAAAEAFRNVHRSTTLPRPLSWMTNGVLVSSTEVRRNEESVWGHPTRLKGNTFDERRSTNQQHAPIRVAAQSVTVEQGDPRRGLEADADTCPQARQLRMPDPWSPLHRRCERGRQSDTDFIGRQRHRD
jgi:hypothetical protein